MEFVGDNIDLRKHLQAFYDAGYADCVNENSLLHAQLQSGEVQQFLREHDFYHGSSVPLPPFTVEEIQLPGQNIRCRVVGETFTVWETRRGRCGTVISLVSLRVIGDIDGYAYGKDSDVPIFSCHYGENYSFAHSRIGSEDVVAIDSSFYLSSSRGERQYFWVNGEAYLLPLGENAVTHLASQKKEFIVGLVREGEIPRYIFTYQNTLYQIYQNGFIRRVRFAVREPVNKAHTKKETMLFFEDKIRVLCQERLNSFESQFRSLGDYHARFGIQLPKPVVLLEFELILIRDLFYVNLISYERGVLRIQREEDIMDWNLVTDEITTTPERRNRMYPRGYTLIGDMQRYETESDFVISHAKKDDRRRFESIYFVCGYKSKVSDEGEEKKAAFIMRDARNQTSGVFFFQDEWYGISLDGVTHLASGVVVFPGISSTNLGVFCIGNILHFFSSNSYAKYRLHRR